VDKWQVFLQAERYQICVIQTIMSEHQRKLKNWS